MSVEINFFWFVNFQCIFIHQLSTRGASTTFLFIFISILISSALIWCKILKKLFRFRIYERNIQSGTTGVELTLPGQKGPNWYPISNISHRTLKIAIKHFITFINHCFVSKNNTVTPLIVQSSLKLL